MFVSRVLKENLYSIKNIVRLEKNLLFDLVNIGDLEGFFISRSHINIDIIKLVNREFGEMKNFDSRIISQSVNVVEKVNIKKSSRLEDISKFLNENKCILVIDGIPFIYGIGIETYGLCTM